MVMKLGAFNEIRDNQNKKKELLFAKKQTLQVLALQVLW